MKRPRFFLAALLTASIAVGVGCSDQVGPNTPPPPPPQADLIGGLLRATGLLRCSPLPTATASQTIGPLGGVLRVGPHSLVVPPGALDRSLLITATAPSGNVNLVQFQPEGLRFRKSAALTMSYANCEGLGTLLPKRIAYTNNLLEILEYLLSLDNIFLKKVTGKLDHFSGYAVAW